MVKQVERNNSKLRFAALRRVSTEQQEKKGESLRTQRTEIEEAVKRLDGMIVEWYGGQEHAVAGHEKKEIDRLLTNAQKKKFNAFIVTHADRWSRDNEKSKQGLKIFREQAVRFFVGLSEFSLFDPAQLFYLGMSAEIGGFQALDKKQKSLVNRIHRAKRGVPACGKLPYGRTFDRGTEQWGIDESKRIIIEDIAKRYLESERLSKLAEEYGMNHANLHKILTKRSGEEWEQTFNSDELNIHETVHTKIPRLLSEKTIKAIKKKSAANKTYTHGHAKYKYLLSRMVFCGHCGYALFGQRNHNGHKYYRHNHMAKVRPCPQEKTWIRADELEDIVMLYLFDCFGNPQAVQKAIEEAIPNLEKIKESQKRIERIGKELEKINKGRDRILRFVVNDSITDSQADKELEALNKKELRLQTEQDRLNENLENLPDINKVKAASKKVSSQFKRYTDVKLMLKKKYANREYDKMTYEEKRALVETVFSGKTPDGKRMGVYIEWDKGKNNRWTFNIHGHLIEEQGLLPLSDSMKEAYFSEFGGSKTKSVWHCRAQSLP